MKRFRGARSSRTAAAFALILLAAGCSSPTATGPTRAGVPIGPTRSANAGHGDTPQIPVAGQFPNAATPWFLTVGDSITSGYTRDPSRAGANAGWPVQLQDDLAAHGKSLRLYNTACPGETTASYATGCALHDMVASLPNQPQRTSALRAIAAARGSLKFIVVDLGSNDLLHALSSGNSAAVTLPGMRARLDAIVADIETAAPGVPVVLLNFYDPFESRGAGIEVPAVLQANAMVASIAQQHHAIVADAFGAFNTVRPPTPRLCTYVDCAHGDIHPTVAGHKLLAEAVLKAVAPAPA